MVLSIKTEGCVPRWSKTMAWVFLPSFSTSSFSHLSWHGMQMGPPQWPGQRKGDKKEEENRPGMKREEKVSIRERERENGPRSLFHFLILGLLLSGGNKQGLFLGRIPPPPPLPLGGRQQPCSKGGHLRALLNILWE